MAYYAKVVKGKVTNVILADENWFSNEFVDDSPGAWIETFKDDTTRGAFAGKGMVYDSEMDAFYPPQQFSSWTLNTDNYNWEAPVDKPDDENPTNRYIWNEDAYQADTSDTKTAGWDAVE